MIRRHWWYYSSQSLGLTVLHNVLIFVHVLLLLFLCLFFRFLNSSQRNHISVPVFCIVEGPEFHFKNLEMFFIPKVSERKTSYPSHFHCFTIIMKHFFCNSKSTVQHFRSFQYLLLIMISYVDENKGASSQLEAFPLHPFFSVTLHLETQMLMGCSCGSWWFSS